MQIGVRTEPRCQSENLLRYYADRGIVCIRHGIVHVWGRGGGGGAARDHRGHGPQHLWHTPASRTGPARVALSGTAGTC